MDRKSDYPQRFAEAVAEVVEQARWESRIGSVRELARLSGMTHTALNARANGKTPYNVKDLAALSGAIRLEPSEVLRRARDLVAAGDDSDEGPATRPKVTKGVPLSMEDSREPRTPNSRGQQL